MMIEKRQTVYNLTTNLLCFFELQFIWDIGLSHRTLPSPLRRAAPMPFNPTARFIVLYISTLVLLQHRLQLLHWRKTCQVCLAACSLPSTYISALLDEEKKIYSNFATPIVFHTLGVMAPVVRPIFFSCLPLRYRSGLYVYSWLLPPPSLTLSTLDCF